MASASCATGKGAQADAGSQLDALPQLDAALPDANDAAADRAVDSSLVQDAPQDAVQDAPLQQDAVDAALPACSTDLDCNPDGSVANRYCYREKGICYTPGTCSSSAECPEGSECKFSVVPPGWYCTCKLLAFPPLFCRDEGVHEDCILGVGLCLEHTDADAGTHD